MEYLQIKNLLITKIFSKDKGNDEAIQEGESQTRK